jgi:sugar/nucleoside kinase (ribokinase family)
MARNLSAGVAGHICLDIIPQIGGTGAEFRSSFLPGRLAVVGPALFGTGGAASNTGLAMHRLGIDVRIMGKVGDDFIGEMIRQILVRNGRGPAAGMIIDQSVNSSYTVVISPPDIDRTFLHYPGANDTFSADDVRYNVVGGVSLFHFGYPPLMARMYADDGAELEAMYRRAKATGVTTSLDTAAPDPNSPAGRARWPVILRRTLPFVDVFLPSFEELLFMLRRETNDRLAAETGGALLDAATPALLHDLSDELLTLGAKAVGIKLGHKGFYLRTGSAQCLEDMGRACPANIVQWAGQELWTPCFKVQVVGTAGSGDCTIAGFLSALLRDLSPAQAAAMAVAVGACNVEAADTLSGVRTWEETTDRVAAGWRQHELSPSLDGWMCDPSTGVWFAPVGLGAGSEG